MKIACTVKELAIMARQCGDISCGDCLLKAVCEPTGYAGVEQFVRADDITDDVKEEPHDRK